jgi:ribonuclease P protein component
VFVVMLSVVSCGRRAILIHTGVDLEQAHVSAQQSPAGQDARVPLAHAHQGRASHPDRSSAQGPPRAFRLTIVLPAAARVRTRYDHTLVAQTGCRVRRGALVFSMVLPEATSTPSDAAAAQSRAGVIAGRRVGDAVTRNRVKRRLRELLRTRLPELPAGSLVVVRALPGADRASFAQLGGWADAGLRSCLAQSRAGLVNV